MRNGRQVKIKKNIIKNYYFLAKNKKTEIIKKKTD